MSFPIGNHPDGKMNIRLIFIKVMISEAGSTIIKGCWFLIFLLGNDVLDKEGMVEQSCEAGESRLPHDSAVLFKSSRTESLQSLEHD